MFTPVSTSNPVLKIMENCNIDGNVTLGKLTYRRALYFFYILFNITYFFYQLCTLLYVPKKTEETNHFQYKYIFYDQDHIQGMSGK